MFDVENVEGSSERLGGVWGTSRGNIRENYVQEKMSGIRPGECLMGT